MVEPAHEIHSLGAHLLPISKAAALVGVCPGTLRNWVDRGHLRAYRTPGGQRRFDIADLQQLLKAS